MEWHRQLWRVCTQCANNVSFENNAILDRCPRALKASGNNWNFIACSSRISFRFERIRCWVEGERVAGNESSLAFFERGAERSFRDREKVSLLLLAFASSGSARVDPLTASSTVETRNSRPIFLFIRRKICKTEEKPT